MLSATERALADGENLETTFEADEALMRLYSAVWYGSLVSFVLWLGYVAFYSL